MGKKSRRARNRNKAAGIGSESDNEQTQEGRRILNAKPNGLRIRTDYSSPRDGTIYSYGNYPGGPEFIAFGAPSNKHTDIAGMILYMSSPESNAATSSVAHGHTWFFPTSRSNYHIELKLIPEGQRKQELLAAHDITTNGIKNPLFEIVPRFQHKDDPENWGGIKAAPEGRSYIVDSILYIWDFSYKAKIFKLFLDGNKLNDEPTNIKSVDLATSLRHLDEWVVSWDDDLTAGQISYVRTYNRYFSHVSKVLFRNNKKCGQCGLMDTGKLVRCVCKMAWYCCPECQIAGWSSHRKKCIHWRTFYDNQPVQHCAHCKLVDKQKNLYCCSRCQNTWYCCEEHQKSDWPSHKLVCKEIIELID